MEIVAILVLLALAGYLLYKAMRKKNKSLASDSKTSNLSGLGIKDASKGDVVVISGASETYDDINFNVDRLNRYESHDETWYELSGMGGGKRIFLEWYEDDELEISIQRESGLGIEEIGLTEKQLIQMDDNPSRSNFVEYKGNQWHYVESTEVTYFKDDSSDGEGFYLWRFQNNDLQLFVEKYEGDPFEVGISENVSSSRVKIYRA
ncbi:MAG: DUF4178 domain-containing protein [Acidobacteriia bacterium]|nr:DUF4178 domain-containing protein [Terriglobia bacterium]